MDEHSKPVVPMEPITETLQELVERLGGEQLAEEPCPVCLGTGTELLVMDTVTVARTCRHIG